MNNGVDKFILFEKDVLESILLVSKNENIEKIKRQYEHAIIIDREFTGVGFYTNFQIQDEVVSLPSDYNCEIGGIHASINNLKYGAGFILFIRDGTISFLEGFAYGEEQWPKVITEYEISQVNSDGSLTNLKKVCKTRGK